MRVLAVETATAYGSVALLDGSRIVREAAAHVPQRHLEWLAPVIAGVLDASGWRPAEVEGVAVSVGPGGFTGLRIGVATAAAWAYARSVPVVGVSTLEAIAEGTATAEPTGFICPVLDARRDQLAFALFERTPGLVRRADDTVGPAMALFEQVPGDASVTFSGDGVPRLLDQIHRHPRWTAAAESSWYPRASFTGAVGMRRLARGEADEPHLLRPVYARPPGVTPSSGA